MTNPIDIQPIDTISAINAVMDIDYRLAFDLAPVGLVLSRNRSIVDCNQHVCEMFGATREQLMGQSFQLLYPSADEFERTGARIAPILRWRAEPGQGERGQLLRCFGRLPKVFA